MSLDLPLTQAPHSICILRLSALGDVCNAVPAVRALQKRWPDCRITWVIGKVEYRLLEGLEGVELIPYDKRSGLRGILALRRRLRGRRFDLLLHMQAALRASLVSLAIPATIRLGFDAARAKDHQRWFSNRQIAPNPRTHVLDGFMDFARAVGADPEPLRWDIPVPEAERAAARALAPGGPYLLISPCSSQRARNFRNWSAEGYARVIDHAFERHGLRCLLTGGDTPLERDYGARITALCRHRPVDRIGRTSLKQLLALVDGARLVLGPDSGPMHMATATDTPALGLYASSNPDRTGPYRSRRWVANRYPEQVEKAFGCGVEAVSWGQRVRDPNVMASIPPEAVIVLLDRLLADTAP